MNSNFVWSKFSQCNCLFLCIKTNCYETASPQLNSNIPLSWSMTFKDWIKYLLIAHHKKLARRRSLIHPGSQKVAINSMSLLGGFPHLYIAGCGAGWLNDPGHSVQRQLVFLPSSIVLVAKPVVFCATTPNWCIAVTNTIQINQTNPNCDSNLPWAYHPARSSKITIYHNSPLAHGNWKTATLFTPELYVFSICRVFV